MWKLKSPVLRFGQFFPLFLAYPLAFHQIGWEASVNCRIQGLAGPLKGQSETFPEATQALPWPSLRSRSIWGRFPSNTSSNLAAFILPSVLTSGPIPAAERHHIALCCHHPASRCMVLAGDDQCSPDVKFGVLPKSFMFDVHPSGTLSHLSRGFT